jgi:crotonobetainyl-CoA:carnitine CoA-transferase CaiB-like acyl-CoA transferase
MSEQSTGPLSGIRVLDWTHVLAGPSGCFQLVALGAYVIRLERVEQDEMVRHSALDRTLGQDGLGEGFCMLGSRQKYIALDAKDPQACIAIRKLIASCDVVMENFRPGKLASLGFDPSELVKEFPQLIVCSMSGYPRHLDRANRPAYDHAIQAASGFMQSNANAQGIPQRFGAPFIDYALGMHASNAVLAALFRRQMQTQTGEHRQVGEWLNLSMLETALTLITPTFATNLVSGRERPRSSSTAYSGSPLSGTFETQEGFVALVCNNNKQSAALISLLVADTTTSNVARELQDALATQQTSAIQSVLAALFVLDTADHWEDRLSREQIPCAKVRPPGHAIAGVQPTVSITTRGRQSGTRQFMSLGAGFHSNLSLDKDLPTVRMRGSDTVEVLSELGISDLAIDGLLNRGSAFQVKT